MVTVEIGGMRLAVDTSDEACSKLGDFRHGQRFVTIENHCGGEIIGVGPKPAEPDVKVLYVAFDADNGAVCFYPNPGSYLKKA